MSFGPKLLFLDVDGVLNSETFIRAYCLVHGERSWRSESLDSAAVRRLNEVIQATGAQIVVSSTWRIGRSVEELQELLHGKGIVGEIVGKTPRLYRLPSGEERVRGHEIHEYIRTLSVPPSGIAIVDDDSDMAHMLPYLVQTSWVTGILDSHISKLVTMLKKPWRDPVATNT